MKRLIAYSKRMCIPAAVLLIFKNISFDEYRMIHTDRAGSRILRTSHDFARIAENSLLILIILAAKMNERK